MSLDPSDKCACPHCNNNIEFDVNVAGREISCPHCDERLTLPRFEDNETNSLSAQITENVFVCPNCRRLSVTFDRDASGKEWTCFECDHTTSIPEFNDDPAMARDRYEDQFLNRDRDSSNVGDSGYHEGNPAITVGAMGCLGFILLIVTFFGALFLPNDMIDNNIRAVVMLAAFFTLIALLVAGSIRAKIYANRVKEFGDLQFVSPIDNQMLEMGDDLRARISLNLNKPLPHGSLGLSLSLLHGTARVTSGPDGYRRTVEYRVLNRNALLVVQDVNFLSGDELMFEFTISTPQHVPVDPEFEEVDRPKSQKKIPGPNTTIHLFQTGSKSYLKAKQLPWHILREEHILKWRLTAELMGPLGVALQRQIDLEVA